MCFNCARLPLRKCSCWQTFSPSVWRILRKPYIFSCRMKEEKFLCLKQRGRTYQVNLLMFLMLKESLVDVQLRIGYSYRFQVNPDVPRPSTVAWIQRGGSDFLSPFWLCSYSYNYSTNSIAKFKTMRAHFIRSLSRLLQTHFRIDSDLSKLPKALSSSPHQLPYTSIIRLPLSEFNTALKVPCPINEGPEKEQIIVFKRLRNGFGINESTVCGKCNRQCKFRNVIAQEMEEKEVKNRKNVLYDILFFFISLSKSLDSSTDLRWNSSYKSIVALDVFLQSLPSTQRESYLFRDVFNHLQNEEKLKQTQKQKSGSTVEQIKKKLQKRRIVLDQP